MDVLANWLWQGCAVAMAAEGLQRLSPRISATTRYRVWWIALTLVIAVPSIAALGSLTKTGMEPTTVVAPPPSPSMNVVLPSVPSWAVAIVAGLWIVWMTVSGVRLAISLLALRRARQRCRPFPIDREARLMTWMSIRDTRRSARLVISDDVHSAAVLGLGAPAIAVAPAIAHELTDSDLDRILVHEWAHVQRRDDVGRLIQVIVMALAGLHPAIWWIDRRLHLERETACDDWTVNITGSAKEYAACLTKLAALKGRGLDTALMPAAFSASAFTTRIVRLLDRGRNTQTERSLPSLACMSSLLVAATFIAAGFELVVTKPLATEAADATASTAAVVPPLRPAAALVAEQVVTPSWTSSRRGEARRAASPKTVVPEPTPWAPNPSPERVAPPNLPPSVSEPTFVVPALTTSTALPDSLTSVPVGSTPVAGEAGTSAKTATPWGVAADAGVSVGRGSQKAAVATAGFFSRVGKSIAGAF